jgi:hypothetical protein
MIRRSWAYIQKQREHKKPIFLLFLTSTMTRRCYSKKVPEETVAGQYDTWNGEASAGDGGTFGAELGTSDIQARVLQFGSITTKLVRNAQDIITSLSQGEATTNTVVLDNADGYFSRMLGDDTDESFVNQAVEIRQGFPGLDYGDYISIARGIVISETPTNKTLTLTYIGLTSSLFEKYELPKSGRYANPKNNNDTLPILIGDLTENTGAQGVSVCPYIDTVNHYYGIACHEILSVANGNVITFYNGDGAVIVPDAITTSGDLEGQGTIAYADFSAAQTSPVTVKCSGAIDSDGALITNPVDAIEYILDLAGDTTLFDATTKSLAKAHADSDSYVCAGVIQADNTLAYHITDILSSFLGSWYINHENRLALLFMRDVSYKFNIDLVLAEHKYTRSPSGSRTHDTLTHQVIANYAYSADKSDKRFKNNASTYYLQTDDGTDYLPDQWVLDKYGSESQGARIQEMNFNFCRNTATINTLQQYLVDTYQKPVWIVSEEEYACDNIHAEPGDYCLFSWEERRDSNGDALKNQVAWVLDTNCDCDNYLLSMTVLDVGDPYPAYPDVWDGTRSAGDGYTFGGDRDNRDLYL